MNQTRRTTTTHPGAAQGATRTTALTPAVSRPIRVLRFDAVRDRTGLSRSTIWRLERRGLFPRHRQISSNAVGWIEGELNDWIRSRATRRGGFPLDHEAHGIQE